MVRFSTSAVVTASEQRVTDLLFTEGFLHAFVDRQKPRAKRVSVTKETGALNWRDDFSGDLPKIVRMLWGTVLISRCASTEGAAAHRARGQGQADGVGTRNADRRSDGRGHACAGYW